jgi:hypothetical protein
MTKLIIALTIFLLTAGICSADNKVGGIPLTTVKEGIVSGGVYFDSYYGYGTQNAGANTITKTFTIPSFGNVEWAMLLTTVYCGNMKSNYPLTATTTFNTEVRTETLDVPFVFLVDGGNDNTAQGGGLNDSYKIVNDHVNRVTSDYMIWYDVTDHVKAGENSATVSTELLTGGFDGRIKLIALVVAYNDTSSKTIHYWINRGHDVDSYYSDVPVTPTPPEEHNDYIGSTNFVASLPGTLQDASLTAVHMASKDGSYTFNGNSIPSGTPQGNLSGSNTWDVKGIFNPSGTNSMTYDRSGDYYKTVIGILTARYQEPVAEKPDLIPTAIKPYHYEPTKGDPWFNLTNYVNVTVNNTGSGDASSFKVRLYAGAELIGEKIISLTAGSSTDVKFEWKPAGEDQMSWIDTSYGSKITYTPTDRTYNLTAAVDEANEIPEENEANNNLTKSQKVVWNGYTGDQPLQNYIKGNVKGGMLYSTGDGKYQGIGSNGTTYGTYYNVTYDLEIPGTPKLSRLYIYYTWAQSPTSPHEAPKMGVTLTTPSGTHTLTMDKGYNDYKGEFGSTYRYPWGTYAYNITGYVTTGGTYKVSVTNLNDGSDTDFATKYGFAAPAILVVYENMSMPLRDYWINEGADTLFGGRKSDGGYLAWWECMNNATFPGSVSLNKATLGIVTPWADYATDDEVYFNDHSLGRGIYCGYNDPCTQEKPGLKMVLGNGSQVSINASDITSYLATSSNRLSQADDGDNMMPANAFLLVEVAEVPDFSISVSPSSASVVQGSSASATATVTSILSYDENVTLSASGIPANANISFTPEKGKPTFTSAMLVNTSNTTPAGSYPINITGTGEDGKVHSTIFTLTVTTATGGANASVSLKTNIIAAIAIEVSPSSIDFGVLSPGETSGGNTLTVRNRGGYSIDVSAEVTDSAENLFVDGVLLNDKLWNLYSAVIPRSGDDNPVAILQVPGDYAGAGSKVGTMMFWAQKS